MTINYACRSLFLSYQSLKIKKIAFWGSNTVEIVYICCELILTYSMFSNPKCKMNRIIVIAILLLNMLANCLHAQDFTYFNKTYGGNDTINILAESIQPIDNGYLVLGHYVLWDHRALYIQRLNLQGNMEWVKEFEVTEPGNYYDIGIIESGRNAIKENNNVVVSYSKEQDFCLTKINFYGDMVFQQQYPAIGRQTPTQLIATPDNGYLIAGMEGVITNDTVKGYVLKVDSLGNFEWDKRYIMGNDARFFSVQPTPWDGGYILGGMGYSTTTGYDMFVVKIYANGDTMWTKRYGNQFDECGALVIPLTTLQAYQAGMPIEYIMTSCLKTSTDFLERQNYIAKIDSVGNLILEGNHDNYTAFSSLQTFPIIRNGNRIIGVCVYYNLWGNGWEPVIVAYKNNLTMEWSKPIQMPNAIGDVYIKDLQPTADGGYVLAGFQYSAPQTAWVLKIDSLGNTCSVANCDSTITVIDNINTPSLSGQVFALSPNPATTQATLYIAQPAAGRQLRIYNMSGQQVKNLSLPDYITQYHFSVVDLPAGVYVCKVSDALGQKLVVGK
jgi:hypothetical protein